MKMYEIMNIISIDDRRLCNDHERNWYACSHALTYSVFTNNVPLAVRFATVAIGMRKAESPEYCRFDSHLH